MEVDPAVSEDIGTSRRGIAARSSRVSRGTFTSALRRASSRFVASSACHLYTTASLSRISNVDCPSSILSPFASGASSYGLMRTPLSLTPLVELRSRTW